MILNLDAAPDDPIKRLMWLSGVHSQVEKELDAALADAYFNARLQGRMPTAFNAGPCSRSKALTLTRNENERRGRTVRWSDGLDPRSSR